MVEDEEAEESVGWWQRVDLEVWKKVKMCVVEDEPVAEDVINNNKV